MWPINLLDVNPVVDNLQHGEKHHLERKDIDVQIVA
jgi:hypothetical protein